MWNLANILSVAMWLAWPANMPVMMREKPVVAFTVADQALELGLVGGPGAQTVEATIEGRVVANCPYHIEASFPGLRQMRGRARVAANDLSVQINGQPVPVGGGRVTIARSAKPTPAGGVKVPINLQVAVQGLVSYPAGQYGGMLVIVVMAGP
jgi:hypothetical protein